METLELFYSIQNCGDGSASAKFMSSKALAEYDHDNMDEGWGELCVGSITVQSESPITVEDKITTPEMYLVTLINNLSYPKVQKFVKEFFPDGVPEFTVVTRPSSSNNDKYLYNDVFVNGVKIASIFKNTKDSGVAFEALLNSAGKTLEQ